MPDPRTWAVDLDGVMWRGDLPIDGSAGAVGRLVASGRRVVFCTNNSSETVAHYGAKLARMGVADATVVGSADRGRVADR